MSTRITVGNIKTMVEALNMVQDKNVSSKAKDYEWYSQGTPRLYTLTRGGKVIIQGMRATDFYFACNAVAETIIDVLTEINPSLQTQYQRHSTTRESYA